jgi:hypothetical protein
MSPRNEYSNRSLEYSQISFYKCIGFEELNVKVYRYIIDFIFVNISCILFEIA